MSRRNDYVLLNDILAAAKDALAAAQRIQYSDLLRNRMLALGLVKSIEIIGEAATQVSRPMREAHPEIPWPTIIGMRNRLVHVYFDIDYELVWKAVVERLPTLVKQVEDILGSTNDVPPDSG